MMDVELSEPAETNPAEKNPFAAMAEFPLDEYGNDYATFGDRLAAAREAAGLGQGQLAKRLGVKRLTVRNWEEDRAEPRANKLQMLAGILNVSLIWLMTGEGDGPSTPETATDDSAEVLLRELSEIRAEHRRLAERSGRLEKRLRALLMR